MLRWALISYLLQIFSYLLTFLHTDPAMAAYRQPNSKQPYVMRSLALPSTVGGPEGLGDVVNHTFWWEVLCLVKPLSSNHIATILSLFKLKVWLVVGGVMSHVTICEVG